MSVLESFYVLFTAETDQAIKGTQELEKANKGVEDQLGEVSKASDNTRFSLLKVAAQAVTAFTSILSFNSLLNFTKSSLTYADSMGKLAESLGIAVEDASAWSDAVTKAGGSTEGFRGSVSKLSRDIYQLSKTGNSSIKPFIDKLGVSLLDASGNARNVLDVLPEIAGAIEGMSQQDIQGLGQKLGLDQGTINLLAQGRRGLDEVIARQKELGVVTQEQAEATAKFNDALDDTKQTFRGVFLDIGLSVLPAFNWLLDKIRSLTNFVRQHSSFFKILFIGLAGAITAYYIPAMLGAAATTWGAIAPLLAFLAPIALVTLAIALLYDEIVTYLEGGESYFGDFVKFLRQNVGWLIDGLSQAIEFFVNAWNDPQKAIEDFKLFLKTVWNDFINSIPGLSTILDTVVKIFETAIGAIKSTIEAVTKTIDGVSSRWDSVKRAITPKSRAEIEANYKNTNWATPEQEARWRANWEAQQKLQEVQQLTPVVAGIGQTVTNNALASSNKNSTVNATINISGSNLTKTEIKEAVKDTLDDLTKTAMTQTDDGISH